MESAIAFFLIDTMASNAVIVDKLMNIFIEFNLLGRGFTSPKKRTEKEENSRKSMNEFHSLFLADLVETGEGAASSIECINLQAKILKHRKIQITKGRRLFSIAGKMQMLSVFKSSSC